MDPKRKRERGISRVWVRVERWPQREREREWDLEGVGADRNMDLERERIFLSVRGWVHEDFRVHESEYMVHILPILGFGGGYMTFSECMNQSTRYIFYQF